MVDFYDVATKNRVDPLQLDDDINFAVMSGAVSPKAGDRVNVVDTNGKTGTVPGAHLKEALEMGMKIETERQIAVREYVNENKGMSGALKVGLGQFADEALLGLPEIIADKSLDDLDLAKKEALKQEHDFANTLGGVAGFAGSLAFGPAGLLGRTAAKGGAMATARLGAKLGAHTAGQVGKSAATKAATGFAQKLLTKGVGGAVEGAISVAPQAVTEAALGDLDLAAETALTGSIFGGVLGAITPNVSKIGKVANKKIAEAPAAEKSIAKKIASVFTGVKETDINYYIKRKRAGLVENQVKDFDTLVTEVTNVVDDIKIKSKINPAAADKLAYQVEASLNNLQDQVTGKSSFAMNILEESDQFMTKRSVAGPLKKMISDLEEKSFDQAGKAAINVLRGIEANVVNKFDDYIPVSRIKDLIRDIDDSTEEYVLQAGAFGKATNNVRKKFRRNIDQKLKKKVPEYKKAMIHVADDAQALTDIRKYYKDHDRIATSLKNITAPESINPRKMLTKLGVKTGTDYKALIDDGVANQKHLEAIKSIQEKNAESVVKNMGYERPSKRELEALEYLDAKMGTNLVQDIKDYAVLRNFKTSKRNGSARTLVTALMGSTLGGGSAIAATIGGVAGFGADEMGGKALKAIIDATIEPKGGLLAIEQAMKKAAFKLDNVKEVIGKTGKFKPNLKASQAGKQALYRLTGADPHEKDKAKKLSRAEKWDKASSYIGDMVSNPQKMQYNSMAISDIYGQAGAPEVGSLIGLKSQAAVEYLFAEMPKPTTVNPYSSYKWQPADYQLTKFEQKAAIVENPYLVIDLLGAGKLTKNHIEALESVYPKIYEKIQMRVMDSLAEGNVKQNYNERVKLSYLLDIPLDPSMTNIGYYQATFAGDMSEDQENASNQQKAANTNKSISIDNEKSIKSTLSPADMTQSNLL